MSNQPTTVFDLRDYDDVAMWHASNWLFGDDMRAIDYTAAIHAVEPVSAWTWTCGANLAQWGAFYRDNGYLSDEVTYALYSSAYSAFPQSEYQGEAWSRRCAQQFDY
jgi:hypothetical protein